LEVLPLKKKEADNKNYDAIFKLNDPLFNQLVHTTAHLIKFTTQVSAGQALLYDHEREIKEMTRKYSAL